MCILYEFVRTRVIHNFLVYFYLFLFLVSHFDIVYEYYIVLRCIVEINLTYLLTYSLTYTYLLTH